MSYACELRDAIRAGVACVNIHTTERPAGEIRGQIEAEDHRSWPLAVGRQAGPASREPRAANLPPLPNILSIAVVSYIVTQGISGARANWHEQLRRGALDFAILLAVSPGPKYGLAIIQYLEQFTDLVVSEGTIYPILGRLTRDELLHAWWVEDEAPHARKYYRLTPAGKRRLTEMKAEWSVFTDKIDRLMRAAEGSIDGAQ